MTLTQQSVAASLENPTYYLENAQHTWHWIQEHHSDLLSDQEKNLLKSFHSLPNNAQALLVRFIMRQGELFDNAKLRYPEIKHIPQAVDVLIEHKFITRNPEVTFTEFAQKLTKSELYEFYNQQSENTPKKSLSKGALIELIQTLPDFTERRPTADWSNGEVWLKLNHSECYKRFLLMYFGNLRQDWSEFVVTELGHIRYESVELNLQKRAFHSREDINYYLYLDSLLETLELTTEFALDVNDPRLSLINENRWLESKRQRVCFTLAQYFEKLGDLETAKQLYLKTHGNSANVRYLRLAERTDESSNVVEIAKRLLKETEHEETRTLIHRVLSRQRKKLGLSNEKVKRFSPSIQELMLPPSSESVERASAKAFSEEGKPVYYLENRLIPALWCLLNWNVVFAPVPGAFFHPFQKAPADLYAGDFFKQRAIERQHVLKHTESDHFKTIIVNRFHEKQGISCPFIHWPSLSLEVIEQALACISKEQLLGMFQYLEQDLRQHRKGFPDLIQFNLLANSFRFLEIKAPNDRLQDHQLAWLKVFQSINVEAHVVKVTWQSITDMS